MHVNPFLLDCKMLHDIPMVEKESRELDNCKIMYEIPIIVLHHAYC